MRIAITTCLFVVALPLGAAQPPPVLPSPVAGQNPHSSQQVEARLAGYVTRTDTGARVERALIELQPSSGGPSPRTSTDGFGQFEFTGLAPGEYRVTATAAGLVSADATVARPSGIGTLVQLREGQRDGRVDLLLAPMSTIEGQVLDDSHKPSAGVTVELLQLRLAAGRPVLMPGPQGRKTGRTDATGRYRVADLLPGDYYVRASSGSLGTSSPDNTVFPADGSLGYVSTYFPGTDRALNATPVRVEVGRDAFGVTFALVAARLVDVSGTVADATGRPAADARVMLIRTEDGEVRADVSAATTSDAGGAFRYQAIPVGTYVLQAFTPDGFGSTPIATPAVPTDIAGVEVTVRPRISARGRLSFEGGPPPAKELVDVTLVPADFASGPVGGNRITSRVNDDWTFEIDELAWTGILRVLAPAGWALKSVMLDGRDITDVPYDFRSADVDGLDVVLTNRLGSVAGTVTDGSRPAAAAFVVIFADDQEKWTFPSRFITVASTTSEGEFRAAALLPGRYRVIAVSALDGLVPDRLASVRALATPVNVSEGESRSVAVTLARR